MSKITEQITKRFVESLENNVCPWRKPWNGTSNCLAVNYATRRQYSLVNQILLGFCGGEWATLPAINKLNGKLNKGAHAKWIVMNFVKYVDEDGNECDKDTEGAKKIYCQKWGKVFNIADTNLESKIAPTAPNNQVKAVDKAEKVIADYVSRSGITYAEREQDKAFYSPLTDEVYVPTKGQFIGTEERYSTIFHELTHSTGHPSRLNREIKNTYGSSDYAKEELVAEMGASMALLMLGIETSETFQNSTAYIKSWLKAIKKETEKDKAFIKWACAKADKAINYIFGQDGEE